jgi:hypothetical protein
MNDPRRLREETNSPLARALLASADVDRPAQGARGRALAAIGVGVATGVATSVATGAATAGASAGVSAAAGAGGGVGSAAAKLSGMIVLKWLSVVVVGGAAAVAALHFAGRTAPLSPSAQEPVAEARDPNQAPASPPVAMPAPSEPEPSPAPSAIASAEVAPVAPSAPSASHAAAAPNASPRAPAAVRASALREQTAALDEAAAALAQGNADRALATLDDLDRRHARGALGEEATVLRIETLLASGNRAAGEALARRFLREHPKSAYAQRIASRLRQSAAP